MISTLGSHTPHLTSLTPKPFLKKQGNRVCEKCRSRVLGIYKNSSICLLQSFPSLPSSNEVQKSKTVNLHLRKMGGNSTPSFVSNNCITKRGPTEEARDECGCISSSRFYPLHLRSGWMKINSPGTHP